jgi:hypothetical protein
MRLVSNTLFALTWAALVGGAQAGPRCDAVSVNYSAPRLVPLAGHVAVVRLAVRPGHVLPAADDAAGVRSPQQTAAFARLAAPARTPAGERVQAVDVYTTQGPLHAWRLSFTDAGGEVELQWLNEDLIFVRAWWGRIVSTDLLFELSSGRFVYAREANYGALTAPCDDALPAQAK